MLFISVVLSAMLNRLVFGFGIVGEGSQFTQVAQGIKETGYRKMYEGMDWMFLSLKRPKYSKISRIAPDDVKQVKAFY